MAEPKRPKWEGGVAVSKGKQAKNLVTTYQTVLSLRLPSEETLQFSANLTELENRLSGKQTVLSTQKSSTSVQNDVITSINGRVIGIRNIVKNSKGTTKDLQIAFGVGVQIVKTVLGVANAADAIVAAYNLNKVWCNSIGILQTDIDELDTLTDSLFSADDSQETNIFARKAATMDSNTLHRAVEDEVTHISALGIFEFQIKNPAVAKLFADLIPSTAPKTTTPVTTPS